MKSPSTRGFTIAVDMHGHGKEGKVGGVERPTYQHLFIIYCIRRRRRATGGQDNQQLASKSLILSQNSTIEGFFNARIERMPSSGTIMLYVQQREERRTARQNS